MIRCTENTGSRYNTHVAHSHGGGGCSLQVSAALSEREELQSKLSAAEATPTSATPTSPPSDVTSLQQKISELEKQLKEGANITPVTSDLHKELAQKSVSTALAL